MRKFTLISKFGPGCAIFIENLIDEKFDEEFIEFMKLYAGHSFEEQYFVDLNGRDWILAAVDNFTSIYKLTKEFKEGGWGKKVPFGYDEGGWHFCLSFDDETYGKVVVNRWTDHLPEDQFVIIANSFHEFIEGLQERPEHLK